MTREQTQSNANESAGIGYANQRRARSAHFSRDANHSMYDSMSHNKTCSSQGFTAATAMGSSAAYTHEGPLTIALGSEKRNHQSNALIKVKFDRCAENESKQSQILRNMHTTWLPAEKKRGEM